MDSNTKKDTSASLVALMGVVLGVVLTLTISSIIKSNSRTRVDPRSWQKLNVILQEVEKRYVDTVDVEGMTDAAVVSALAKLDPHSVYLPPQDLEESETELAGNFDGIGIQFNVPNDTAIVLEVIPGGPSEKVGLLPGDRLLKVDDKVIAGVKFPQDSMVRRMKGPSGTKVIVTVLRGHEEIPFEITRGKIPVHCVDASFMIDDRTGYMRLTKFSRTTYKEVSDAAVALLKQGMKRLIFDIRDNTGGYLDQALLLSNMFLSRGDEIVFLKGRNYAREDHKADGRGILQDIELSVLINESSASSSEIFAGAIQDNDRGVIVGRRSFGKGLVQEPVFFTDGSGVRITIARFYTPSGRCIQKPYGDDYGYDIYRRYEGGEMFAQDSIKVDSTEVYKTVGGRTVYGGGGIVPDVFVPMDTTRATDFFIACNRKTTQMRFASEMFDRYRDRLLAIDSFPDLEDFLDGLNLKGQFLDFAKTKDGIAPKAGEWEATEDYLMPQLRALVGRYSKLGDNAFYKLYLPVDDVVAKALAAPSKVETGQ
ncbi:MAG: PDZ domain-containing protein [Bacteroidales bacterium]|nr:PDZ domain-containing protein [Bacteroidales bacterium]